MRILITGGNGFIGSHVISAILNNTNHYVGLLLRSFSDLSKISDMINSNRVELFMIDQMGLDQVFIKFQPDVVLHLAAYYKASPNSQDKEQILNSNILFPARILDLMSKTGVRYFINTGTFSQYLQKVDSLNLESEPIRPRDLYSASKVAFEDILKFYSYNNNISAVTLVLMTPYGERDDEDKIVPYLIKSSVQKKEANISPGEQSLDFVYVGDVALAYLSAIKYIFHSRVDNDSFLIGSGKSHTIKQIADIITEFDNNLHINFGKKSYPKSQIFHSKADITKTKNQLKWWPKTDIKDGINKTYRYYMNKYGEKQQ